MRDEFHIDAPASIFTKRHSGAGGYHHEVFHDDDHVVRVLTKILDDASRSHPKLEPAEGLQDAQLDNGARIHIVHSDVGPRRAPAGQHPQVLRSAAPAVHLGRDAVGVEYEPPWADLARANLDHARANGAAGHGEVVCGDARHLNGMLDPALRCLVALVLTGPP